MMILIVARQQLHRAAEQKRAVVDSQKKVELMLKQTSLAWMQPKPLRSEKESDDRVIGAAADAVPAQLSKLTSLSSVNSSISILFQILFKSHFFVCII